jgi:hypothetical protein
MRTIEKAFLSCALVAAAALLAATPAMATNPPANQCAGFNPAISIVLQPGATEPGACTVAAYDALSATPKCKDQSTCSGNCGADYTGIQYKISGGGFSPTVDLVSTLVTANNLVPPNQVLFAPGGTTPYGAGSASGGGGDTNTGLGKYSVHEQAYKVKVNPADGTFWVLVLGNKQPVQTSIAVKKGNCSSSCIKSVGILGLGLDLPEGCVSTCGGFNFHQAVNSIQLVSWEGCQISKYFSPTTGVFQGVTVDPPCTVTVGAYNVDGPQPVSGLGLGGDTITFGTGDVIIGDASCINTFVGGVYSRVCR